MGTRETRWRADPAAFVREALIDPETGRPFELYPEEERFLREGFTVDDGRLPFPELIFSGPKKLGKTCFAGICTLYLVIVLGGPYAEGYCVANDFDQAQGRVFQAITRIIEASPKLRDSAKITANRIEFLNSGSTITAIASDFAGAAARIQRLAFLTSCGAMCRSARNGFGTRWCRFRRARSASG